MDSHKMKQTDPANNGKKSRAICLLWVLFTMFSTSQIAMAADADTAIAAANGVNREITSQGQGRVMQGVNWESLSPEEQTLLAPFADN